MQYMDDPDPLFCCAFVLATLLHCAHVKPYNWKIMRKGLVNVTRPRQGHSSFICIMDSHYPSKVFHKKKKKNCRFYIKSTLELSGRIQLSYMSVEKCFLK